MILVVIRVENGRHPEDTVMDSGGNKDMDMEEGVFFLLAYCFMEEWMELNSNSLGFFHCRGGQGIDPKEAGFVDTEKSFSRMVVAWNWLHLANLR